MSQTYSLPLYTFYPAPIASSLLDSFQMRGLNFGRQEELIRLIFLSSFLDDVRNSNPGM